MGADGPGSECELAGGQPDPMRAQPGGDEADWAELDPWARHFDIGGFLASFPGAESVIVQLNRLLYEFLGGEVLALADQAAAMGVDPSPSSPGSSGATPTPWNAPTTPSPEQPFRSTIRTDPST